MDRGEIEKFAINLILSTYKPLRVPDEEVTMDNGEFVWPVATLESEYGGRAQIIIDDHCYLLLLKQEDGTYSIANWIFDEAHEVLKNLPNPSDYDEDYIEDE